MDIDLYMIQIVNEIISQGFVFMLFIFFVFVIDTCTPRLQLIPVRRLIIYSGNGQTGKIQSSELDDKNDSFHESLTLIGGAG